MISAEIKVNGQMIAYIYARNSRFLKIKKGFDECEYYYEVYTPDAKYVKNITEGFVRHKRSDGWTGLFKKIIALVRKDGIK